MPDHPFARSVAEKTANKSGWPNNENDRPLANSSYYGDGGAEGDRTPDLRIANAALCQTELLPHAEFDTTVSSFRFQVRNNPQITPMTQIEKTSLSRRGREPKIKRHNEHSEPTTPPIDIRS